MPRYFDLILKLPVSSSLYDERSRWLESSCSLLREKLGDEAYLGCLEGEGFPQERVLDSGLSPKERDWVGSQNLIQSHFYFSSEAVTKKAIKFLGLSESEVIFEIKEMQNEDWNSNWQKSFKSFELSPCWRILPAWESEIFSESGKIDIKIEPGMGFGTGDHPTTSLCLKKLGQMKLEGKNFLDFGSGSGILSIAAIKRNASFAQLIEIDESANENARKNFELNQISQDRYQILESFDWAVAENSFDVVVANILLNVLLENSAKLCSVLKQSGSLILSGILENQLEELKEVFANQLKRQGKAGFKLTAEEQDDWRCLIYELES